MQTPISQKDTTFTKIFVGGLPYHTTDQSLKEFFEQFGDIEEAVVITDRQTGKSRGYGFVTMSDRAAAERACKDPNPIIDGRKANVNLAYLGAKPRGIQTGSVFPFALQAGYPGLIKQATLGQYGLSEQFARYHTESAEPELMSDWSRVVRPALSTGTGLTMKAEDSMPQYVYPSAYLAAATNPGSMGLSVSPSPLSPTTAASQAAYYDYPAGYPLAQATAAAQFAATGGYEAAYPYTTNVATGSYMATPAQAYSYALPQQALQAYAHLQPQQIQERMQ